MILRTFGDFTILGMDHTTFIIVTIILLVLLALICYFLFSIVRVKDGQVVITEHAKKYKRTLDQGFHMAFLLFESPVCAINLTKEVENNLDTPNGYLISKYKVCFSVTDAKEYYYQNAKIMNELNHHLKEIINLNLMKYDKDSLSKNIEKIKKESLDQFENNNKDIKGININNLFIF